jgi:hypothetical protein
MPESKPAFDPDSKRRFFRENKLAIRRAGG